MMRNDQRANDQLRKINIQREFSKHAEGSCLIEFGSTRVICTATVEKTVPVFLKNQGVGWITAEYGMLPRSTHTRVQRERDRINSRSMEIQRLIGRSLRSVIDTKLLGERTIWIDCDVIQADGGTRTASIVGGYVALADCVDKLCREGILGKSCVLDYLGAVSVGILRGECILDLNFEEDSRADVDMNVIMQGNGEFIELQGTGEHGTFSQQQLNSMLELAKKGINEIIAIQRKLFQ
jgi:ribonuclease PH